MHDPIRVGMIGAGQIATQHLSSYQKIPEVQVVAVADLQPEKIEEAKKNFNIPDGYADYRELLARDDIDAVDVCVHNNKHAPLTIAGLQAGKHVYCEKPMAGTYRDASDMLQAAKETGKMLHIQMGTLYGAETKAAQRLIEGGHLGKIYYARSFGYRRRGRPFVDGYGSAAFVDKSISAGGALYDMGIYHIAQILHLIGNPEVLTVTGAAHQELDMDEARREFSGYSVEEMGLGWVRMAGGISFDIEETWAVHHDGQESSKVLGSQGGLRLGPLSYFASLADMPLTATFDVGGSDTRWHANDPEKVWYDSSQKHWAGALLGKVPLLPTAEIGLNAALISEGIYFSSKLGRELSAAEIKEQSKSTSIDPFVSEKVWK